MSIQQTWGRDGLPFSVHLNASGLYSWCLTPEKLVGKAYWQITETLATSLIKKYDLTPLTGAISWPAGVSQFKVAPPVEEWTRSEDWPFWLAYAPNTQLSVPSALVSLYVQATCLDLRCFDNTLIVSIPLKLLKIDADIVKLLNEFGGMPQQKLPAHVVVPPTYENINQCAPGYSIGPFPSVPGIVPGMKVQANPDVTGLLSPCDLTVGTTGFIAKGIPDLAPYVNPFKGELKIPYTAVTTPILEKWLKVLTMPPTSVKHEVASMAPTLASLPQNKCFSASKDSWLHNLLPTAEPGTILKVASADGSVAHQYLRLDKQLWIREDGTVSDFSLVNQFFNSGWSWNSKVYLSNVKDTSEKVFKTAWEEALRDVTAHSNLPAVFNSSFVHWDELAYNLAPPLVTESMRTKQVAHTMRRVSSLPWWMPSIGSVFRVKDSKGSIAYLCVCFHGPNLIAEGQLLAQCTLLTMTNGSWEATNLSLSAAVASLLGVPSVTLAQVKACLDLTKFDFSDYPNAHALYEKVPRKTGKFEPCIHGSEECFKQGGKGYRYHPVGYQHPVQASTAKTKKSAPPAETKPMWYTDITLYHKDKKSYLEMRDDGVKLRGKEGGLGDKTFAYADVDAHDGVLEGLDLSEWGIVWADTPKLYPCGASLPGMAAQLFEIIVSQQGHLSKTAAKNPALPPSMADGDFLVQRRNSGLVYGVLYQGTLNCYTASGEKLTEKIDRVLPAEAIQKTWGTLKDLVIQSAYSHYPGLLNWQLVPGEEPTVAFPKSAQVVITSKSFQFKGKCTLFGLIGTTRYCPSLVHDGHTYRHVFVAATGTNQLTVFGFNGVTQLVITFASEAQRFVLSVSLGFSVPATPKEVKQGEFVYSIYERNSAPANLPAQIYSAIFLDAKPKEALVDLKTAPYAQLVEVRSKDNHVAWFVNFNTRCAVWTTTGSMTIFFDDCCQQEADFLATLGFTVPVTETSESSAAPEIVLHTSEAYPDPNTLTPTGETRKGATFSHTVLKDAEGNLWLWKAIPATYDKFVVEAESCGSKVAYMILGNKSVYAAAAVRNGEKGTLQPLLPSGSELVGRKTSPTKLPPGVLAQFMMHHPVSWLISDHDPHGDQFMITPDGSLVGLDKGQAWKHFPKDTLSCTYFPNGDKGVEGPYFYNVYPLMKSGVLDREEILAALASVITRIKFAKDLDISTTILPLAQAKFPKKEDQEVFLKGVLSRKHTIDKDFNQFLSEVLGEQISLSNYSHALKLANLEEVVFSFPSSAAEAKKVEYEVVPAQYVEEEKKILYTAIAAKHSVKVSPHNKKDYLVTAMSSSKTDLEAFLKETALTPVGNAVDADGLATFGMKATGVGWLVALHKTAFELGSKVETTKTLKSEEKKVLKSLDNGFPSSGKIVDIGASGPLKLVDYVPLTHAFKGRTHNYDDLKVIAQVPKFPPGGANIFLGNPYIFNNYLNILKVRIDGLFFYELTCRVEQAVLTAAQGSFTTEEYCFRKRYYNQSGGYYEEQNGSSGSMALANFKAKLRTFEDGSKIWLFADNVEKLFAMVGTMIVRIPVSRFQLGKTMEQVLRNLLSTIDIAGSLKISNLSELIVAPTAESLERVKLMKACFSRLSWKARTDIDMYADTAVEAMKQALTKANVQVDELELAYLADGHVSTIHKSSAKMVYTKIGKSLKALTHGGNTSDAPSVLKHGLLSPIERSRRGVSGAGAVNARDFLTGGAETAMVCVGMHTGWSSHYDNKVTYVISPSQLDRTDLFFHNSDQYGSMNPKQLASLTSNPDILTSILNTGKNGFCGGNELIFMHSIPPTAILAVFAGTPAAKKSLVTALKAEGITVMNGIPVDEFVHDNKDYEKMTQLCSKVMG